MRSRLIRRLVAATGLLLVLSACDRQIQYAVLTTVFTGVPPMDELYGDTVPEQDAKEIAALGRDNRVVFKHPLWESRQCGACHQPSAAGDTVSFEWQIEQFGVADLAELPAVGGLLLPADKLCVKCHLDKTGRRAIRERLWLHNPVARGDCLACHSEHKSLNLSILKRPLAETCLPCHQADQLPVDCASGDGGDSETPDCLSCHNTHVGRDRMLLRRDFTEVKVLAVPYQEPMPAGDQPTAVDE